MENPVKFQSGTRLFDLATVAVDISSHILKSNQKGYQNKFQSLHLYEFTPDRGLVCVCVRVGVGVVVDVVVGDYTK